MKNAFKKLAAVAMAFTLLGTGTAVSKTIAPQTDNTLTASACNFHGQFRGIRFENVLYRAGNGWYETREAVVQYCQECGSTMRVINYTTPPYRHYV